MKIAVTGATGFLGRYLVAELTRQGHELRCWYRRAIPQNEPAAATRIEWIPGEMNDEASTAALLDGCQAVIHAALDRPGKTFRGGEGDLLQFAERNVIGSLRLMEHSRRQKIGRFIFISTCAVHEKILDDRPLDETHPVWPLSHYGAHKAALEMFVHSYGWGHGLSICSLRPSGIYGTDVPPESSKWYDLIARVVRGETVEASGGGKEVHAADVARAAGILLNATDVSGESYNCTDRYISHFEVAQMAQRLAGTTGNVRGAPRQPRHRIVTDKLKALGMAFGGLELLEATVAELVRHAQASVSSHGHSGRGGL